MQLFRNLAEIKFHKISNIVLPKNVAVYFLIDGRQLFEVIRRSLLECSVVTSNAHTNQNSRKQTYMSISWYFVAENRQL